MSALDLTPHHTAIWQSWQRDLEKAVEKLDLVDDVAHFKAYVHFVNVDLARNRQRFYTLTWQPSLWDGEALVRTWGRVGTQGRSLTLHYGDRRSARSEVLRAIKRRLQRGYQVVEWG